MTTPTTPQISDVANQKWKPEDYQKHASFVAVLGQDVIDLLDPKAEEKILDLGCGDGVLTKRLQNEYGCSVVGVDSSPEQVLGAQKDGLDVFVMSGMSLEFNQQFDAVFSNAALHWMKDAGAVIQGVRRALKPKGRFVAEFGGEGNVNLIRDALHSVLGKHEVDASVLDPWYFPSPATYQAELEEHGFIVDTIELIDRPTALPGDIDGWLLTFSESFLSAFERSQWPAIIAEIREVLRPKLLNSKGVWMADYKRLRFSARLKT